MGKALELQVRGCTVRGVPIDNLDDPTFEVKPGENIVAGFTISMEESWVLTNVFAVILTKSHATPERNSAPESQAGLTVDCEGAWAK